MLRFESFVFTCLTYRNVQRFRNGPVHEFYGLKAGQKSKVRASSHEYPHIEKSKIFGNRNSKVQWPTTVTAKEITSRQRKTSRQKNNLAAKRKSSRQKEKLQGKKNNLMAKRKTSWQKRKTTRQKEN